MIQESQRFGSQQELQSALRTCSVLQCSLARPATTRKACSNNDWEPTDTENITHPVETVFAKEIPTDVSRGELKRKRPFDPEECGLQW